MYFIFDLFVLSISADYAAKLEELEKSLAAPVMSSGFDDLDAVSQHKNRILFNYRSDLYKSKLNLTE